jgi:hypothetical protein
MDDARPIDPAIRWPRGEAATLGGIPLSAGRDTFSSPTDSFAELRRALAAGEELESRRAQA